MRRLTDRELAPNDLVSAAEGLVLDATLEVAGKLTVADVQRPTEGARPK